MQIALVRDARQPRIESITNAFPDRRAHAVIVRTQAPATGSAKTQSGRFRRKDAAK
jgi:hypothetical protein